MPGEWSRSFLAFFRQDRRGLEFLLLGGILVVALALRAWGLSFGLPVMAHTDEPILINVPLNMLRAGDANPHFFNYPSLMLYAMAAVYGLFFLYGAWRGFWRAPEEMQPLQQYTTGTTWASSPSFVLVARLVVLAIGLLTIYLVYRLGKRLYGRWAGLGAAFFLAISNTHARLDHFATMDVPVTCLVVATTLVAVRAFTEQRGRDVAVAGLLAGLAISTKYNALPIVVTVALAPLLWPVPFGRRLRAMALGLALVPAGFLLGTPYALLDMSNFLPGLFFGINYYQVWSTPVEGSGLLWYARYLMTAEGPLVLLALAYAVRCLFVRRRHDLLVLVFVLSYGLIISCVRMRNDRTVLPLLPFIALLAGAGLAEIGRWLQQRVPWPRMLQGALLGVLVVGLVVMPFRKTVLEDLVLTQPDARSLARSWIEEHLPALTRLAAEAYSPPLDPSRYATTYLIRAIDHDADWYRQQGFEYVVLTSAMYSKLYNRPDTFAAERGQYEALFAQFPQVVEIRGAFMYLPNFAIRICRVPSPRQEDAHVSGH